MQMHCLFILQRDNNVQEFQKIYLLIHTYVFESNETPENVENPEKLDNPETLETHDTFWKTCRHEKSHKPCTPGLRTFP